MQCPQCQHENPPQANAEALQHAAPRRPLAPRPRQALPAHKQAQDHPTTATTMYREMDMTYWLGQAETEIKELSSCRIPF